MTEMAPGALWDAFFELLEQGSDERARKLRELESQAPRAAARLRSLLEAHESTATVLDTPLVERSEQLEFSDPRLRADPVEGLAEPRPNDAPLPPRVVGGFEIVERIGRGGMAEVFRARRPGSQQRVALKILRPAGGRAGFEERLTREISALERLEHPNIARLIDHGRSEEGEPWIAMEFVDGLPIDQACRERGLDLEERLRLFADICDAVQAAHSSLIAHRDIKPSNILLDDRPRLLDFGIAKELDQNDLTATVDRRMTITHASPEQLRGERVTTATDIYSLGVLLCQLLTECLPYSGAATTGSTHVGALASDILAGNTLRPSEIVRLCHQRGAREARDSEAVDGGGTSGWVEDGKVDLPAVATPSQLEGDLDAIVLRATAFEPHRRYASAADLAEDVRRYIAKRPITARPDSLRYRASKLIRRHPVPAGLIAAAALAVCTALIGLTMQTQRLERALGQAAEQASRAELNNLLLLSLINEASPIFSRGEDVSLGDALSRSSARLLERIGRSPLDELRLRIRILTPALLSAGRTQEVHAHLDAAQDLLVILDSTSDGGVSAIDPSERRLMGALVSHSRSNLAQLEARYQDAVDLAQSGLDDLGPSPTLDTWEEEHVRARLLLALARGQSALGQLTETLATLDRAAHLMDWVIAAAPHQELVRRTANQVNADRGRTLASLDRFEEALAAQDAALEITAQEFGILDPETVGTRYERGLTLERMGRFEEARSQYVEVMEGWRRLVGDHHGLSRETAVRLASVHQRLDEFEQAGDLYESLLAQGPGDAKRYSTLAINYGWLLHEQGRYEAAREHYEAGYRSLVESGAPEYQLIAILNNLGLLAMDEGRYAEAARDLGRSQEIARRLYGEDHSVVAFSLTNLARLKAERGERAVAERDFRGALAIRTAALPENHPDLAHTLLGLGRFLCSGPEAGPEAVEEGLVHALRARSIRAQSASRYKLALATLVVSSCQERLGRLDRSALTAAIETVAAVRGDSDSRVRWARELL